MGKVITLALIIVLALVSTAGYFFLNAKINTGETRITAGKKQIKTGGAALEAGKAQLKAGESKLAKGKQDYADAHSNPFLVAADNVLQGGKGFSDARDQIAAGDKKVEAGQDKVDAGKTRLDAGKLRLEQGKGQLRLAKGARIACGSGAILLFAVAIALGFFWRRSLIRTFTRADA